MKKLMLIVIFAGLATVADRFLPVDVQQKIYTEVAHLSTQAKLALTQQDTREHAGASLVETVESTPRKKYVLDILDEPTSLRAKNSTAQLGESDVANAYMQHSQDIQVAGEGEVVKILADDNQGSRHQRFIVRVPEGFTVLIAHNIDLAPRVRNITSGDKVAFYGEYVWNEKGGVVHWTHNDPRGRHLLGWLKHKGVTYQ